MKKLYLFLVGFMLLAPASLWAQAGVDTYNIDAANNGRTIFFDIDGNAVGLYDNGGPNGNYTAGDYYITIGSSCPDPYRFCLVLSDFDIPCMDTLYIYDGADTNGAIRAKINNCMGYMNEHKIFVSPQNTSGTLTVRFKTGRYSPGGAGFTLSARCETPCERIYAVIDSAFYRTRNNVIYDTAYQRQVPVYDTTYNINSDGDTLGIRSIDTNYFTGVHLCVGDGVIFKGHGVYTHDHGYYDPSDANTMFIWDMAHEGDTLQGLGLTEISYDDYKSTGCFDLTLTIIDAFGCTSNILTTVKIRTSVNPIKTIFTLADICNNRSLPVNMGYDGEDATLTLRTIESNETVSKINEIRTFIPDGPPCRQTFGSTCYSAPVLFNEFPPNKKVQSGADICSICINMEHTYMGDITVRIVCPSGASAPLFFGNYDPARTALPDQEKVANGPGNHGSSKDMGCPHSSNSGCDTLQNPYGVGLEYCWSRNNDYLLVTGEPAGSVSGRPIPHDAYITSAPYTYTPTPAVTYVIPPGFTGAGNTVTYNGTTKMPSDHVAKTGYYLPYTDFSELIGCPLNGTWAIEVCDDWGGDNGYVFSWGMDICGVTQDNDCKYEVGIDSLVWRPNPDPQYHDYDLGHYRGVVVERVTPTISYISSPDTAGNFPIDVFVYDEFGCVWDTVTRITTYWTPEPNLGPDTNLCGVNQTILDARDRHAATEHYSYVWSPFGQDTPTIETQYEPGADINYTVRVINTNRNTLCTSYDTIAVGLRTQPVPNFLPQPFTLEGCDPMTITFNNSTLDADSYFWDFGDGITSQLESPTHTYAEGVYTLKYYAISSDGCVDSVISPAAIAVYPAPHAAFSWEPVYPSVLTPIVTFDNNTFPRPAGTHFLWEIQYNPDNPLSVETLTDENATFDFSQYATDGDISGVYGVRLIARTDNLAPSGNIVYCSDTAANTVLVINDYLQFPNVITPNGDGINDRFVIQNLVEGMGYPINTLDIYNKWGTCVFHKENIASDNDFWDPSDMPAGTYFYRFSARGYNGNIEHNGAIEIIK